MGADQKKRGGRYWSWLIWSKRVNQGGDVGGKVKQGEYAPTLADWMMLEEME